MASLLGSHLEAVKRFHGAARMVDPGGPGFNTPELQALRFRLMAEELEEYRDALNRRDLVDVLDALCDMEYVLLGTVLQHGLGGVFNEAFSRVHLSNMKKFSNGVILRDDGKILKPKDWQPPNLRGLLREVARG